MRATPTTAMANNVKPNMVMARCRRITKPAQRRQPPPSGIAELCRGCRRTQRRSGQVSKPEGTISNNSANAARTPTEAKTPNRKMGTISLTVSETSPSAVVTAASEQGHQA